MRVSFSLEAFTNLTDIGIHSVRAREAYLCEYAFRVTRDTERTLYLSESSTMRSSASLGISLALAVFAAICKIGW